MLGAAPVEVAVALAEELLPTTVIRTVTVYGLPPLPTGCMVNVTEFVVPTNDDGGSNVTCAPEVTVTKEAVLDWTTSAGLFKYGVKSKTVF